MKKLLALLMVLCMALPAAALAEETAGQDNYVPQRIPNTDINWSPVKREQEDGPVEYEVVYAGGEMKELGVELEENGEEYEVLYDGNGKILRAEYETDAGEIVYDGTTWRDKAGKEVEGPDLAFMEKYFKQFKLNKGHYPNNTMCVAGLSLREMYPGLTDRWYHILPVDLTKEGVFRYRNVVSNMYFMGYTEVTVKDGKVTVDYAIPYGNVTPEQNCLAWFTSVDEITHEFLENPTSSFRFGVPVDIQQDLKGQNIAILFICNRISYQIPLNSRNLFPAMYSPNQDEMKSLIGNLRGLLQQMKQ